MTAAEPRGDLVYLAPHSWHLIAQRAQHLTAALAERGWRVLYVEPIAYSALGNLRRLAARQAVTWRGSLIARGEHLWSYAPPPGLPLTMDAPLLNRLGHQLALTPLRRTIARLGLRQPRLIVGWPLAAPWVGRLGESMVVYDCMDDFPAFHQSAWRRRLMVATESSLAAQADSIVATSGRLQEKWHARGYATQLIPNGVVGTFVETLAGQPTIPADLAAIPAPRLIYIGSLGQWFDQDTLVALARRYPEWSLVVIAPRELPIPALEALPNVHLLGPRQHRELPGYLAGATVGLIPFTVSPLTVAVNPVKLYEYLAAGLPVVSTPLPELEQFADLCYIGASGDGFIAQVERAVAESDEDPRRERRRLTARQHTWAQRAADFSAILAGRPSASVDNARAHR